MNTVKILNKILANSNSTIHKKDHTTWWSGIYPKFTRMVAAAKSLQLCPTLCDPIDGSPPGSPIPGILQARILEWVAISFSNSWKWKVKVKSLSCVQLLATPWTTAYQAPPSMGFSRQEHWSGVPLPSPQGWLYICKWINVLHYINKRKEKNQWIHKKHLTKFNIHSMIKTLTK